MPEGLEARGESFAFEFATTCKLEHDATQLSYLADHLAVAQPLRSQALREIAHAFESLATSWSDFDNDNPDAIKEDADDAIDPDDDSKEPRKSKANTAIQHLITGHPATRALNSTIVNTVLGAYGRILHLGHAPAHQTGDQAVFGPWYPSASRVDSLLSTLEFYLHLTFRT